MGMVRIVCGLALLSLVTGACSSGDVAPAESVGESQHALTTCVTDDDCGLYACHGGFCEEFCGHDSACHDGAHCEGWECVSDEEPADDPCGPGLVSAIPLTSCTWNDDCALGDRCYPYAGYICCHDPYNDR